MLCHCYYLDSSAWREFYVTVSHGPVFRFHGVLQFEKVTVSKPLTFSAILFLLYEPPPLLLRINLFALIWLTPVTFFDHFEFWMLENNYILLVIIFVICWGRSSESSLTQTWIFYPTLPWSPTEGHSITKGSGQQRPSHLKFFIKALYEIILSSRSISSSLCVSYIESIIIVTILWKRDIFAWGYYTVRISSWPMPSSRHEVMPVLFGSV